MKLLITGGAGCLGSNLIEHYMPHEMEICVIDNFATSRRELLEGLSEITIVEGTVANKDLVDRVFREFQPSHVIHCAASYKNPQDWAEDIATNITGSVFVTQAAEAHDVRQLINFQTALCYGLPREVPIPIDHPTAPVTSYGISKTAGEAYILQSKLPAVSLRLANICGPRLSIGPIPTFYSRLKAGKSCFCTTAIRDFLEMDDFLKLMDIILYGDPISGVFNVSSGQGKSIREIYNSVAEYLGLKLNAPPTVPVGEDDIERVVLDPSHTEKVLGWKASTTFESMIQKQLNWYDANGVASIYSHLRRPGITS